MPVGAYSAPVTQNRTDGPTGPATDRAASLPEALPSQPIRYIDRTRRWYDLLGYEPYRWPHHDDVPFTPLTKPLSASRLALVTTAAPVRPDAEIGRAHV